MELQCDSLLFVASNIAPLIVESEVAFPHRPAIQDLPDEESGENPLHDVMEDISALRNELIERGITSEKLRTVGAFSLRMTGIPPNGYTVGACGAIAATVTIQQARLEQIPAGWAFVGGHTTLSVETARYPVGPYPVRRTAFELTATETAGHASSTRDYHDRDTCWTASDANGIQTEIASLYDPIHQGFTDFRQSLI